MYAVPGVFKDGVALPDEPVEGCEGRQVMIAFLDASQDVDDGQALKEFAKKLIAEGPSEVYTPPVRRLSEVPPSASDEEPIDPAEWDRQWAIIESEMKQIGLDDERAEGLI